MKKVGIALLLLISIVVLGTETFAEEELIFGPTLVVKGKGKAQTERIYFEAEPVAEATYVLSIEAVIPRSTASVSFNGTELTTRKTPFVNGVIKRDITPVNGSNAIDVLMYKGEISVAVRKVTAPVTSHTLHCAVIGENGMLVGSGTAINVQILEGESLNGVTGEDGFCAFTNVPLEGVAVLNASSGGTEGSEVVSLKSSNENVTSIIYLYSTGPGKVSGYTDPNSIVQAIFKAPVDYPIPNTLYKKAVMSDTNGFYMIDKLPLERLRIQVNAPIITPTVEVMVNSDLGGINTGNEYIELTETSPEVETDVDTSSPCPINSDLHNGDFSLGTFGWETEGDAGTSWQPYYFHEEEEDPCNPSDDPTSFDLKCGVIVAGPDATHSSLLQTFVVPEGASTLECRIRYRNEAYRSAVSVTDPFSVRLETKYGTTILAEGDANTYPQGDPPPEDTSFGLVPYSAEIPLRFDVSNLEGEVVKILAEIRHEGTLFRGMLGISDVKVVEKGSLYFHSSHSLTLPSTLSIEAGMITELVFKNTNPLLGSAIVVVQAANGQITTLAIPVSSTDSVSFNIFGCEPMGWTFNIRSLSSINPFIFCDVYSSWVPGMPENNEY